MTSKVLKKYKFKKIKQRWVSFGVLDYSAKIASHLTEPFSHSYIKSEAMSGCRNEFSILKLFSAHLHHYNQTDGFDPEWFPEASRSLYDVIQLYKEVQKNVPIDTPRMRVLS